MTSPGRTLHWAILASLCVTTACGGATPDAKSARSRGKTHPAQPFPSRDSLAQIASAPVTPPPVQDVASATDWNVTIEAVNAPSPAETRFAQVAGKSVTYSKELRCAARELARFQVEHGAQPNERLKRFMIAACGTTNQGVAGYVQSGDVPAEVTDEQVLTSWQKKITVPPELKGSVVGVAMARNKKRAVFTIAYAKPEAEMTISPVDAAGAFTVNGTAPANTEYVLGLVNQGASVASCEPDAAMPLPLYTFHCTMGPGDKTAWVEVGARAQGRLLLHSTGLGLARRDPTTPVSFTASGRAPRPVKSPADLENAILEGVNRARSGAKLGAVELAATQSTTNERLAPHFFAASFGHDQQKGDLVGLGLIAGWDVAGTIKRGNLFSAMLSGTSDANDWLDYALEVPMGRHTMLGAETKQIAVGASSESGALGAVVTGYDMFTSNDHRADAALVFRTIEKARLSRGLPVPTRMEGVPAVAQQARLVNEGRRDTDDALDAAMVAVRDHAQRSVHGWVLSSNQLEALQFPPELLGAGPLDLAIEVTHHKEQGAAWGSYVVFLVTPSPLASPTPTPTPTPQTQAAGIRTIEQY